MNLSFDNAEATFLLLSTGSIKINGVLKSGCFPPNTLVKFEIEVIKANNIYVEEEKPSLTKKKDPEEIHIPPCEEVR